MKQNKKQSKTLSNQQLFHFNIYIRAFRYVGMRKWLVNRGEWSGATFTLHLYNLVFLNFWYNNPLLLNYQANKSVKMKYLQLWQHLAKSLSEVYSFSWVQLSREILRSSPTPSVITQSWAVALRGLSLAVHCNLVIALFFRVYAVFSWFARTDSCHFQTQGNGWSPRNGPETSAFEASFVPS